MEWLGEGGIVYPFTNETQRFHVRVEDGRKSITFFLTTNLYSVLDCIFAISKSSNLHK